MMHSSIIALLVMLFLIASITYATRKDFARLSGFHQQKLNEIQSKIKIEKNKFLLSKNELNNNEEFKGIQKSISKIHLETIQLDFTYKELISLLLTKKL